MYLKGMCILLFRRRMFYVYLFILSNMLFKFNSSLLIFCLDDLSIDVSGVLKSPTVIVFLSISPFMFVNIFFMYLCAPMLGA